MKAVGVIPARWASTRFPGKSLAMLCGKPLVQWVHEKASMARSLDQVLVATDDERIAEAVRGFNGTPVMTSPDHPSGTDRVAEAVRSLDADVVVNIQGDEPMMDSRVIDLVARKLLEDTSWHMATAARPISTSEELTDPSTVKVVFDERNRALFFSRSVIPFERDAMYNFEAGIYWCHVGIYAYRRRFLERFVETPVCETERAEKLEQLRALHIGASIAVLETGDPGIGVDTPEDLASVAALIG